MAVASCGGTIRPGSTHNVVGAARKNQPCTNSNYRASLCTEK